MADTVGDFIVQRLQDWGVRRVYGYPGDGINGITAGIRRSEEAIDFVQVRHEENAAFAACAHAKYAGELGVCVATSGPGAIHLLNGLYDAKLDHQPVLAIVGQQPRSILGAKYFQEVDLVALYNDVAGDYVHMAHDAAQVRHLIDRAARTALAHRTVTCVIVPADLQMEKAVTEPGRAPAETRSSSAVSRTPHVIPDPADLERAADILNSGERVAMLVGQGALGASAEVREVAHVLGAGVAKALLGKAVVGDDEPWVTGAIGMLGTKASWNLMQECDTLLMVGTNMPYSDYLPEPGSARGIQIDIDGSMLGFRYPTDVNLVGDSALTLRALMPLLQRKEDRRWREKVETWVADWWGIVEARAMNEADPINGQRVLWELSPRLPDRAMIACDCGTATGWYARDVKMREGMIGWLSGSLLTMGNGLPYAIAAKFAHPDRPCIALLGDGAMQMTGMAELITVAKYWREWTDPRLVVLVLNNRDLSYVTWEQRAMAGDVRFEAAQDLPDVPYARYADLLGLGGQRVEQPEEIAAAWDSALAADRPTVLDVVVDPNVPPLPPHISSDQAEAMAKALLKGDPDRIPILRQTFRDLVEDFIPQR